MYKILIFSVIYISLSISSLAQEVQVPMAQDNKINVIDRELEAKLNLFPEYQNFTEARLFKIDESSYVLEISYQIDNRLTRKRINMTAEETNIFRTKVTEKLNTGTPGVLLNQEGRTRMLIYDMLFGLGAYGWMIPTGVEINEFKISTGVYMLVGAGSFFVPYWLTKDKVVTDANTTLHIWGNVAGMAHGALLYNLFGGDQFEGSVLSMATVGITEGIAGYMLADKTNMYAGKADVIAVLGTFGFGYGLGTAVVSDINFDTDFKAVSGLMIAGSFAGMLAGNWIANTQHYTRGDAFVLGNVGILGAWIPATLLILAESDDKYIISSTVMAGATAGLWLGDYFVRGLDFTEAQGTFISLGTAAGVLLGGGTGYIVSSDDDQSMFKSVTSFSAIGGGLGFALMYNTFKNKAKTPEMRGSLDFNISPFGLTSLFNNRKSKTESYLNIPLITMSYKF